MANLNYSVNVTSPCPGSQRVDMVASNYYAGAGGSFTYAILSLAPGTTAWEFTVYDYSGSGPCAPMKTFRQVTPSASDPLGPYQALGPNGPDPAEGEGNVADYP